MPAMPVPEPINVLHYAGADDDHNGIVSVVRALASSHEFSSELGVNPGFIQHRVPPLRTIEFSRIEAETISLGSLWRSRRLAREARRWLTENPNRIFHGHSRAGMLVALWLARWRERRAVVSVHCYGRRTWFYRRAARQLGGRLFWLSPAMKVHYGVEPATWDGCVPDCLPGMAKPARPRRGSSGRLVVGGAGMFVRWKQWHLMLDALALLPAEIRGKVTFRHIGAPDASRASRDYERELKAKTEAFGLSAQVNWLGWQSSSEKLLEEIDCLVVTSRREPFSMAALEALFAGVPIVAADEGGPTDLVDEGTSGWFFRRGDAHALAETLKMLVTTDAIERARIDPARLAPFSVAAVARRWRTIYERLIRP